MDDGLGVVESADRCIELVASANIQCVACGAPDGLEVRLGLGLLRVLRSGTELLRPRLRSRSQAGRARRAPVGEDPSRPRAGIVVPARHTSRQHHLRRGQPVDEHSRTTPA